MFHSKKYSRRGNSNSYSISYLLDNEINYGGIEYFLEINNNFYAFITKQLNIFTN